MTASPRRPVEKSTHAALTITGFIAGLAGAAAYDAETLGAAIQATQPIVDLRLRSEQVRQDGLAQDASAVTLRGRLGFETGRIQSTSLLAEAELVWPLDSDYNSTVNGKTAFPVVADPENYEVNRLQLTNTSLPATTLILGRQRIDLDDQRFVGAVGWRQNEQTFDALRVINTAIPGLTVDLTYLNQANRVFGKDSPAGRYTGDNYLANLALQTPLGKLSGFAYLLDFDQSPRDSSQTFGLRLAGKRPLGAVQLAYSAAYASQHEYAGNPLNYSADYSALELTGTIRRYSLGAGIEVLGGDGVEGFSTPLATLHIFQGWADKFLTTPPNGIEDRYLTLGYKQTSTRLVEALTATAAYHRLDSARSGLHYGSEIDAQVRVTRRRWSALLKYADYNANGFATDTRKWWLQLEFAR